MSRGRVRAASLVVGTTGAMLLAFGSTAFAVTSAKASVDSPTASSGTPKVTSTTAVRATVDQAGGTLAITGPSGYSYSQPVSSSSGTQTVACSFDPRSGGCSGTGILTNGTYTVTASSKAYSTKCGTGNLSTCSYAASSDSKTFWLAAPPAAPANVDATQISDHGIRVSWSVGSEPDLLRYDLLDGSGNDLYPGIAVTDSDFCSSDSCHIDVIYPDNDPGGQKDFRVRAWRSDGNNGDVRSAASSPASASIPAPPSSGGDTGSGGSGSSGGDSGSSGGGSGGSSGGSTGGGSGSTGGGSGSSGSGGSNSSGGSGSGVYTGGGSDSSGGSSSAGGAFGGGFSHSPGLSFTTSDGHVTIPHIAGQDSNPDPKVAIPWGTYKGTLGYKDQVSTDKVREKTFSTRLVSELTAFTDGPRLWKSLAGALVLIMIAMHMRQFTRSHSYE